MSLEHAILGFLQYKPFTGYDLKKIFDTSVRHFWPADQSQIYRTLTKLAEQGMAEQEIIEQSDRPDRKVYHITPAGRDELSRWLVGPFPMEEARSAPLVQVFFAGQLSDEEILAKFEGAAAGMRSIMERYEQVPGMVEGYVREVDDPRETYFWMLTLEMGITSMRANLDWLESVIARIRSGQVPSAHSHNIEDTK
ncbi:MAG: PadR family transcriptional regulator [Anaerolineaceae bacterium]